MQTDRVNINIFVRPGVDLLRRALVGLEQVHMANSSPHLTQTNTESYNAPVPAAWFKSSAM